MQLSVISLTFQIFHNFIKCMMFIWGTQLFSFLHLLCSFTLSFKIFLSSFILTLFSTSTWRGSSKRVCVCVRPVCRMTCFVGRSDIVHVVAITARPDCEQTQSCGGTRQGVLCSTVSWVWACLASSVSQLSVRSFRTRRLRLCFLHRCGLRPCRLFVCSAGVSAPNCLTSLTNPS